MIVWGVNAITRYLEGVVTFYTFSLSFSLLIEDIGFEWSSFISWEYNKFLLIWAPLFYWSTRSMVITFLASSIKLKILQIWMLPPMPSMLPVVHFTSWTGLLWKPCTIDLFFQNHQLSLSSYFHVYCLWTYLGDEQAHDSWRLSFDEIYSSETLWESSFDHVTFLISFKMLVKVDVNDWNILSNILIWCWWLRMWLLWTAWWFYGLTMQWRRLWSARGCLDEAFCSNREDRGAKLVHDRRQSETFCYASVA